jgi:hypothetical protein
MYKRSCAAAVAFLIVVGIPTWSYAASSNREARISFSHDAEAGTMTVVIDGKPAFIYQHHKDLDLTHFWPVNSPSGKNMLVQKTEPYPHHRALWFADKIRLDGGEPAELYNALYSGTGGQKKPYKPYTAPFRNRIRHVEFSNENAGRSKAHIEENLVWEIEGGKPAIDEHRDINIRAMSEGQFFIDITFTVTASYGPVEFVSDAVHYAWPYIRMNTTFSVDGGGTITNSEGGVNQDGTHDKVARWVDYSTTVDGVTEGLAVFSHPSNDYPHKWLTRDYGCFGPRRNDEQSGKPFTLKKGESISQRIGILIHTGDVEEGAVSDRYTRYAEGNL